MEAVFLHRVGFLAYSCPKQGQDFKPSAAPLHPNIGQVPPPPPPRQHAHESVIPTTLFCPFSVSLKFSTHIRFAQIF